MNDAGSPKRPARPRLEVDADAIRELSGLLNDTGLTEIEIEENGRRIRVARASASVGLPTFLAPPPPPQHSEPQRAAEPQAAKRDAKGVVASPMVGTVYIAPEPSKPPFVKVGDTVREGDTLLIVEAMKTMNPISAPHAGVVREICVTDAEPVEFGQTLMIITPAGA